MTLPVIILWRIKIYVIVVHQFVSSSSSSSSSVPINGRGPLRQPIVAIIDRMSCLLAEVWSVCLFIGNCSVWHSGCRSFSRCWCCCHPSSSPASAISDIALLRVFPTWMSDEVLIDVLRVFSTWLSDKVLMCYVYSPPGCLMRYWLMCYVYSPHGCLIRYWYAVYSPPGCLMRY